MRFLDGFGGSLSGGSVWSVGSSFLPILKMGQLSTSVHLDPL